MYISQDKFYHPANKQVLRTFPFIYLYIKNEDKSVMQIFLLKHETRINPDAPILDKLTT